MTSVVRTVEQAIALGLSRLTMRWPNDWWPTGNAAYDDCAAFVSWLLFGLNGNYPFQTYVSGVIERSGLEKRTDVWAIRRGDAVGFLWSRDGSNYHHIELALDSPDANGWFTTLGTNAGPNDDVAIRRRHVSYVPAYGRPAYLSPSGGGTTPIEEDELATALETIMQGLRREGAARGRLIFDAGPNGDVPWDKATRAALVGNHLIWALEENAADRLEQIAQLKSSKRSLILPWQENPAPLTSVEFNREVDFLDAPDKPFGSHDVNWIELDPAVAQTTWQQRADGKRYPYQSRWAVWADLRPVECRFKGVAVERFVRVGGKSYAVLVNGSRVELPADAVARADKQRPKGQRWVSA